jgi:tRNA pseudouridine55 synthase
MLQFSALDGALLVDKPSGCTSHDVVDRVRRHFKLKKVGHCGTLDPNATGLLILVLGQATRLSEKFMSSDKVYEGDLKLGEATDSYDSDGEITGSLPVLPMTLDQLNAETTAFLGDQYQMPPMVSAVKVKGVPLYKLARQGQEVERQARLIHVYNFKFTSYEEPIAHFRLACTKGTYVRTIAHELGQKVGCGAHLTTLRRLASGKFDVADATPLATVLTWDEDTLARAVIPYLKLKHYE